MKEIELKIGDTYQYSEMNPENRVSWMDMFLIGSSGTRTIKNEESLQLAYFIKERFLNFKIQ